MELEDIKDIKELLDTTIETMKDRSDASKALSDIKKRVITSTNGDKSNWALLSKVNALAGEGWAGDPFILDPKAKYKDAISQIFIKLLALITATEEFNVTDDILGPYLDTLKSHGIILTVKSDEFNHADTSDTDIEEELQSSKSYIKTVQSYNEDIQEQAEKAESMNITSKKDYSKVVNIYNKGLKGKEIDDDVQNILTNNEMLDTAVNKASDLAKEEAVTA